MVWKHEIYNMKILILTDINCKVITLMRVALVCFCYLCSLQSGHAASVSSHDTTSKVEAKHAFKSSLTWFGQVKSAKRVNIPARVNGLIINIGVADETSVKQGDVLFTLAGKEVESKALNLQQQLAQTIKNVQIARKTLRLKLNQRKQGLTTNEQVNLAEQTLSLAKAHAAAAREALTTIHTGSRITAPISGIFTTRTVHIGQYISRGMVLASVVAPYHNRIQASLFSPIGIQLKGKPTVIHASKGVLHATISAVMPESNAQGAMQIWIDGDALNDLMPGMQISGELVQTHLAVGVPASAIARDDAGNSYLFIQDGQHWRKQQVRTGIHDGDMVEVSSGVHGNEVVATEGVYEMLYQDFGKNYHAPD